MLNIVVDSNVLVSGLLGEGTSRAVLNAWLDGKFEFVTSQALLDELTFVLKKTKLAKRIPETERNILTSLIKRKAVFFNATPQVDACRDQKDNMVLACAIAAEADIVSGDKDLLILSPLKFPSLSRDIEIIPPADFLKRLKNKR